MTETRPPVNGISRKRPTLPSSLSWGRPGVGRVTAIAVLGYSSFGLATTFAVSAMVSWRSFPGCTEFQLHRVPWGEGILQRSHQLPDSQGRSATQQYESSGFGWRCQMASSEDQPLAGPEFRTCIVRESGWPFYAFTGGYDADAMHGYPIPERAISWATPPAPMYMWAFIPIGPVWLGLLADVALYAVLFAVAVNAPGAVRRRVRARAGRCVRCGYQLATAGTCPECGHIGLRMPT